MNPFSPCSLGKCEKAGIASFDALLASFTAVLLLLWIFSAVSVSYARSAGGIENWEESMQKIRIGDRLLKSTAAKASDEAVFSHEIDESKVTPLLAESLRKQLGLAQLRIRISEGSSEIKSVGSPDARDCIGRVVSLNGEVARLEVCT